MKKFLALLCAFVIPSAAVAQTNVNWGLATGPEPRALGVFDTSHTFVPIGTINSSTHVFSPALGYTPLNPALNLSDVASAATSRTNLGLGTAAILATGSTTGTVPLLGGSLTNGHCVSIDGTGRLVDAGGACTTGGGGGTVSAGTIGQLAVYTGSTTSVGSFALANDCTFSVPNITCTKLNGVSPGALFSLSSVNLSTQVTGTLQSAQEPAHTGDVTNSAGSLALSIAANAVTNAKLASGAAAANLGLAVAPTNTALTAMASTASPVTRLGVYSVGDAPPLLFVASGSACTLNSGSGDGGSQVPTSDGKCWVAQWNGTVTSTAFAGVDPSGASNSDVGYANFLVACMSPGNNCFTPPGNYHFANNLTLDLSLNGNYEGFSFYGAGQNATMFTLASGKKFQVINTVSPGVSLYQKFSNFGVTGSNSSGPVCQYGQNSYADAINGVVVESTYCTNTADVVGAQGMLLNEVYSSTFLNNTTSSGCTNTDYYANGCANSGYSLVLRQASFNFFTGSYSGGRAGIYLTAGYSFGNVFNAIDDEVTYHPVMIDSAAAGNNQFNGGQYEFNTSASGTCGIYASAGASNIFNNLNMAATYANFICPGAYTGVHVTGSEGNTLLYPSPSMPASGTIVTNTFGRNADVQIYNNTGAVTVCYGGPAAPTCIATGASSSIISVPVRPGDGIKVTYSAPAPAWIWIERYY